MKLDIKKDEIGLWVVCTAIKDNHFLIDKMEWNEDKTIDVHFTVGGVELDFNNVANRIEEIFDQAVTKKAQELLSAKYDGLLAELDDIKERISEQKTKFLYPWEDN